MKSRAAVLLMILASNAALSVPVGASPTDAQAQASALLSRQQTPENPRVQIPAHSPPPAQPHMDAQMQAAALLSRAVNERAPTADVSSSQAAPSRSRTSADAQAQAAALLTGAATRAGG